MREDDAGRPPVSEHANPLLKRLANSRAPLLAPALLFAGALGGLAARRHKDDGGQGGSGQGGNGNGGKNDAGQDGGSRRDGGDAQNRHVRDHSDRTQGEHGGNGGDSPRHDSNHDGHHAGHHDSEVIAAATKTPTPVATSTPTPKSGGGGGGG